MPNWVNNTITTQGAAVIAAAIGGTQLVITRVAVGSGIATGNIAILTALVNQQMNLIPVPPQVSANNIQSGEVIVMATLDSALVGATFSLTELGVFGESGGGAEVLIAYCQASASYDSISTGSGSNRLQITEQIPIVVGVGASVSITVQAGNPVYVPPVVGKTGITVLAPLDSSGRILEWDVYADPSAVLLRLSSNVTLYVTKTGNDTTAIVNDASHPWATLQGALNWLNTYFISTGFTATISMGAGTWTNTSSIIVNHPQGSQISIIGAAGTTLNGTSLTAAGGTVTVAAAAGTFSSLTVGTVILVVGSSAASDSVGGCRVVSAVATNGSTVSFSTGYTSIPSMVGQTATLTPLVTVLSFSGGISGVTVANGGLGLLQNIGIIGGGSGNGLVASNNASVNIRMVGVRGFLDATGNPSGIISSSGGVITATSCSSTGCSNGFTASGANLAATGCFATNNANGFRAQNIATMSTNACLAMGNQVGLAALNLGNINDTACYSAYNTIYGASATNQSEIQIGNGTASFVNNGSTDIFISILSAVVRTGSGPTSYGSCNIAPNAFSTVSGCYFAP
jgi:hypothetical protein